MAGLLSSGRAWVAIGVGRSTTSLCRALGRAGGVLGGRVALVVDPGLLARLTGSRWVALVSGTNGKSTTTAMLASAVALQTRPAWNRTGANMADGALAALLDAPEADSAVLEIDEGYLPGVISQTRPALVVLLNMSRDQLDRVGELASVVRRIRAALLASPHTTVIANAEDPLVVAAAQAARRRIWVAPPRTWRHDGVTCLLCGSHIDPARTRWRCSGCGLRRPATQWAMTEDGWLSGPDGYERRLALHLPGTANLVNAAFAVAAATAYGVSPDRAAEAVAGLDEVAGRYRSFPHAAGEIRLLLAKNPAGWSETLAVIESSPSAVVIAVNSREADGRDPSWLWDVPFERLRGRRVTASGDRAADVAVRLAYAEVDHDVEADPVAAACRQPGPVDLAGDYTAFLAARARVERAAAKPAAGPVVGPAGGQCGPAA
ncbi:MurT ligase domain-containing protein [Pseudonocardia sp. RS11V-5]|uniref:MurT ligase domain-containing protein n=1 Tax=Pseudonocardia terrae TaxID=2905831 RepID=UPI001E3D8388|nr:MurT ligase domain-containing protein [Pseudonocardia terrae]MCE3556102.1 MurT ligase domain-containing protein [Pseudonocardia terrae]